MKGLHPLLNETIDRWHRQVLVQAFADMSKRQDAGPVVDLGCGYGRLAPTALQLKLVPLIGLDFTPGFCVGFQERYGSAVCGSLSQLPFRESSLSAAYAVTALMYLSRPETISALQALSRCISPGGTVLVLEPSLEFNGLVRRLLPKKGSDALAVDGLSREDLEGAVIPADWIRVRGGSNAWMTAAFPLLALTRRFERLYHLIERAALRLDARSPKGRLPRYAMYRWSLYRKP